MGSRLPGFDYSRPYFYMVTIRRNDGYPALSRVCGDAASHYIEENWITRLFVDIIMTFHETWYCIEPIRCFSIMPDHIHGAGGRRCADARSGGQHLFAFDWHDWIVKADGQLAAFTRYIRENPERSWRRQSHREYFQRVNEVPFLGRKWYGYGNAEILKSPILEPMRYSRKLAEGGKEWNAAVARAGRIGPGGAGIGTFMSPCEKACGHALGQAGGRWVVLSPEGFGERWHPGRQYERFCAEGRMLFLSLWPAMAREPTKAELYDRCHLMGDIIVDGLGKPSAVAAE